MLFISQGLGYTYQALGYKTCRVRTTYSSRRNKIFFVRGVFASMAVFVRQYSLSVPFQETYQTEGVSFFLTRPLFGNFIPEFKSCFPAWGRWPWDGTRGPRRVPSTHRTLWRAIIICCRKTFLICQIAATMVPVVLFRTMVLYSHITCLLRHYSIKTCYCTGRCRGFIHQHRGIAWIQRSCCTKKILLGCKQHSSGNLKVPTAQPTLIPRRRCEKNKANIVFLARLSVSL